MKNENENNTETDEESYIILRFSLNKLLPSGCTVVPILSLPIKVNNIKNKDSKKFDSNLILEKNDPYTDNLKSSIINIGKNVCASCIRESILQNSIIYVLESPGLLGIGGKVWDSTFVLVNYLKLNGDLVTGYVYLQYLFLNVFLL